MGCGWPGSPGWGQSWLLLLLLLLHVLEVLLPGPHLCVLQLLHVEGLSVGQELLPLILQLPVPTEYCYQVPQDTWANASAHFLFSKTLSLSWCFPKTEPLLPLSSASHSFHASSRYPHPSSLHVSRYGVVLVHFNPKTLNLLLLISSSYQLKFSSFKIC